jgi:1,4-dihydroxy-2-naphthoate octaprenyltransferase
MVGPDYLTAAYLLGRKASGSPLVLLIVAATLAVVATVVAGWARNIWAALIAATLALTVVALIAP